MKTVVAIALDLDHHPSVKDDELRRVATNLEITDYWGDGYRSLLEDGQVVADIDNITVVR